MGFGFIIYPNSYSELVAHTVFLKQVNRCHISFISLSDLPCYLLMLNSCELFQQVFWLFLHNPCSFSNYLKCEARIKILKKNTCLKKINSSLSELSIVSL